MTFMPHGKQLVAGQWVAGDATFTSEPAHGASHAFSVGTADQVDTACRAAEEAFWSYGYSSRAERAAFLRAAASQIEALGDDISAMGMKETGLPEARLEGERGRTVAQIQLFADHIVGQQGQRRDLGAFKTRQEIVLTEPRNRRHKDQDFCHHHKDDGQNEKPS